MEASPYVITAGVRAVMQDKVKAMATRQQQLLAKTRKLMYDQIMADAAKCKANPGVCPWSTLKLPDGLWWDYRQQLVRELCARFPGKVGFAKRNVYRRVDEFVMIQDEATPPVSFDYRVYFE